MATLSEVLDRALGHHQAGALAQAEALYREILQADPHNVDAWHLLGLVAHQTGRTAVAVDYIGRAVALAPGSSLLHFNLGEVHRAAGQLDAAAACYQQALALEPTAVPAHNNLGIVRRQQGRLEEAVACYQRALQIKPDHAAAHNNLGELFRAQGRLDEAIACFRRALQCGPPTAEAYDNLADALRVAGQLAAAAACYRQLLQWKPDDAATHNTLGVVLSEQGQLAEALPCFQRAVELDPRAGPAYTNWGRACHELGRLDEAVACYRQALALQPDAAGTLRNLGNVLVDRGQLEDAVACYRRALRTQPDDAELHNALALALLSQGDFAEGCREHEWRWQTAEFQPLVRDLARPVWDGSPLPGQAILLHAEQGLGDILQFVRYATVVKERCGEVIFEGPQVLLPILARCPGLDRRVACGQPLPPFAAHAPLLSLMGILQTTRETIPAPVPYVFADPDLVAAWGARCQRLGGFRLGINWYGRATQDSWRFRNIPLQQFAAVAEVPGVHLVSLHQGPGRAELAPAQERFPIVDFGDQVDRTAGAFMDTAAIMMNLDLILTCDTALAHLAGALGVPVWVALPHAADWRWFRDRDDSPWYPTMRLFRQPRPGDWDTVFQRIGQALRERVGQRLRPPGPLANADSIA